MPRVIYGYARVSSMDQNLDRQIVQLKNYGIEERNILCDKASGKTFERKAWNSLVGSEANAPLLREGDLLVVVSLDRLGRNYQEIRNQWQHITQEIRADIKVLDMPLLDTRQTGRDLTGTFVADLVLQILSYVAQTERENIRQRQMEGIAAAKLRGVQFGRPRKPVPESFFDLKERWERKEISSRQAAKELHIAQDTFLRWVHEQGICAGKK